MIRVKVENLPYSVGDVELRELFSDYGTVKSSKVMLDRETFRSRGYGFVEFATAAEAEQAVKYLNNTDIGDRTITVTVC